MSQVGNDSRPSAAACAAPQRVYLRPLLEGALVGAVLIAIAAATTFSIYVRSAELLREETNANLLSVARSAAAVVDPDQHQQFSCPEEEASEEYAAAIAPLRAFLLGNPDLRFLYTGVLIGERVHFVLDATPPGDADGDGVEDHSAIMDEYDDADPIMVEALACCRETVSAEPYSDAWGRFFSAYAPIRSASGACVGVLGVDMRADRFDRRIAGMQSAAFWGFAPVCLIGVAGAIGVTYSRASRLRAVASRAQAEAAMRESEERFRNIADSAPVLMWVCDADGRCVYVNHGCCRLLGVPAESLLGDGWLGFVHPDDREWVEREYAAAFEQRSKLTMELRVRCADGKYRLLASRGEPRYLEDGTFAGLVGASSDITELHEAAELSARARDAAEAASRSKSEFLANMSHEIRTPMTAILGFADLLLESPDVDDEARSSALRTIRRNGDHLLAIINDILDLSKIESGKMVADLADCSPAQLLTEVIGLTRVRADAKHIELAYELESELPAMIRTDPIRVRQILINLIGNAIKFTDSGRVVLLARTTLDGERYFECDVIDSGVGMTPEQVARLFDAFAQVDTSATRRFGGTGLGLAISRRLARLLGGDVWVVESRPGHGTRFRMRIAAGLAAVRDPASFANAPPAATPPLARLACHVLLVEDGVDNQRLISTVLRKSGATVEVAENGRIAVDAALRALREGVGFDVILMDMQMPVLDGYSAARELRSAGYERPIIALTAHSMSYERARCIEAGCDDFCSKPIDRRQLLGAIQRAIDVAAATK